MLDQYRALLNPKGKGGDLGSRVHQAMACFDVELPQVPGAANYLAITFVGQGLLSGARGAEGNHAAADPACAEGTSLMRTNIAKRIKAAPDIEDTNACLASKRNNDLPLSRKDLAGSCNCDPLDPAQTVLSSPDFSSLVYCAAAIIRPGCVTLGRPPRRTVKVRLRRPRSQALPGRPLQRLATTSDEKSGL